VIQLLRFVRLSRTTRPMTGPSASYRGLLPFRIQSPGSRPSEIGASTDQVPARAAGQKSKLGSFRKPATRFGSLGSFRSTSALDPLHEIGFVSKKPGTGPAGPITFFELASFRRTRRKLPTSWVRFAPPGLGPSAARFGSFRNRWDMPRDRVPSPDAAAPRAPGFR
jgi:hypothetical protein